MRLIMLLVLACLVLPAQTQDPAADPLNKAYEALRDTKYLEAIGHFRRAAEVAPSRAAIHKDLGYAYLKAGDTEAARDSFERAFDLSPADLQVALELAFLCYETGAEARALDLFDRVRRSDDPALKKTAEDAFVRVDSALRAAIERWSAAVAQDPANRAAHLELARNLEKHREPARAAEQYLAAWRLPPRRWETLLDLARARQAAGDSEAASGAWLLASRASEARVAERARTRLPQRAPFANEYRRALDLDPLNTSLRCDLAFLWLAVSQKDEALRELEAVVQQDPDDMLAAIQLGLLYLEHNQPTRALPLLEKVAAGPDTDLSRRAQQALGKHSSSRRGGPDAARPHKDLGQKSLAASYLKDALREFQIASEIDPDDGEVAYKLGVVLNILKQDREALRWFARAMRSRDATVAVPARQAYENLAPRLRTFQTSLWTLPMFSTRWGDAFQYAQLKTEVRLGSLPLRPYVSLRVIGDWKRRTAAAVPQFLSESSLIAGVGLRTVTWNGLTLWGEAGEAASYLRQRAPGTPRFGPDYRGGVAWFRNMGASLGSENPGLFAEINVDAVFLSRYANNVISYWQMRHGYRLPQLGWLRSQLFWNSNITLDRRREYYANFVEFGPGVRFRVPGVHPPLDLTISALRGVYLINDFNPRRPNYYDLRVGLWYSIAY